MIVTREEIEKSMDALARKYVETHDKKIIEELYELACELRKLEKKILTDYPPAQRIGSNEALVTQPFSWRIIHAVPSLREEGRPMSSGSFPWSRDALSTACGYPGFSFSARLAPREYG